MADVPFRTKLPTMDNNKGSIMGVSENSWNNTQIQNTTINFIIGAKEFIGSFLVGNTHIGPLEGCDEKGVPYAHHEWVGYFDKKNSQQALEWNEKAYNFHVKRDGERHPNTVAEKCYRAVILACWDKKKEAMSEIIKTVEECQKAVPLGQPGDEITLVAMDQAALVHEIVGEYYLAESLSEKTYAMYEVHKKFGATNPSTLSAMLRRAQVLELSKKYGDAKALYEKAYTNLRQDANRQPDLYSILILYHRARLFDNLRDDKHKACDAYKKAEDACREFLVKDPYNKNVCAIKGRIPP